LARHEESTVLRLLFRKLSGSGARSGRRRDDTSGEYRVLYADARRVSRVYRMNVGEQI
jgi:hypothetical protein